MASGTGTQPLGADCSSDSIGALSYRCAFSGCLSPLPTPPWTTLASAEYQGEAEANHAGPRPRGGTTTDEAQHENADDGTRVTELQRLLAAPHFEIDEVIDPADTRRWLTTLLEAAGPPQRGNRPNIDTW